MRGHGTENIRGQRSQSRPRGAFGTELVNRQVSLCGGSGRRRRSSRSANPPSTGSCKATCQIPIESRALLQVDDGSQCRWTGTEPSTLIDKRPCQVGRTRQHRRQVLECTLETAIQYPVALTSNLPPHNNGQMPILGRVRTGKHDLRLKRLLRRVWLTGHLADRLAAMESQSSGTALGSLLNCREARFGFPLPKYAQIATAFRIVSAGADDAQDVRGVTLTSKFKRRCTRI